MIRKFLTIILIFLFINPAESFAEVIHSSMLAPPVTDLIIKNLNNNHTENAKLKQKIKKEITQYAKAVSASAKSAKVIEDKSNPPFVEKEGFSETADKIYTSKQYYLGFGSWYINNKSGKRQKVVKIALNGLKKGDTIEVSKEYLGKDKLPSGLRPQWVLKLVINGNKDNCLYYRFTGTGTQLKKLDLSEDPMVKKIKAQITQFAKTVSEEGEEVATNESKPLFVEKEGFSETVDEINKNKQYYLYFGSWQAKDTSEKMQTKFVRISLGGLNLGDTIEVSKEYLEGEKLPAGLRPRWVLKLVINEDKDNCLYYRFTGTGNYLKKLNLNKKPLTEVEKCL